MSNSKFFTAEDSMASASGGVRPSAAPTLRRGSKLRQAGDVLGKKISTQGLITANGACMHRMYSTREKAIGNTPADGLLGNELGPNYAYLNVWENDLLIAPRVSIPENGNERLFEGKPIVFASTNGLKKPGDPNMTNKRLNRYFRIVGVAATARRFGPDTNNKGGVSIYVAGSMSIYNRSNVEFNFGDYVRALLPHVSKPIRDKEQSNLPYNSVHPKERMEPILEKFNPSDAIYLQGEAITQSFTRENVIWRDIARIIDPDSAQHQDEDISVAQSARLFVQWISYVAISAWADTYGGQIRAPDASNIASFKNAYNQYQGAERVPANIISKKKVTLDETTNVIKVEELVTEKDKSKKLFDRLFVASKLGLYRDDQGNGALASNSTLVEAIFARSMRALIMDGKISDAAKISITFPSGMAAQPTMSGTSMLNTIYNSSSFVGQMENIQNIAGKLFQVTTFSALSELYDSIIGKCINHSMPGEPLDLVMA